jgi:hypothetical protein
MDKAKRAVITIIECEVVVDGFLVEDGEYVMSQSDVGKAVNRDEKSLRMFLKEKQIESLSDSSSALGQLTDKLGRNGSRIIKVVSLDIATDFWLAQAFKGNKKAQVLVYGDVGMNYGSNLRLKEPRTT